jgi:uncharacterized protein (TIGR02147 family)
MLQEELARRCRQNARYSLRSFAHALGISPASLSLVLNRKRPLSARAFEKIGRQLEWDFVKDDLLSGRLGANRAPAEGDNLSLEEFHRISTWICYAILSLLETKDFRADAAWIARRLGTTIHEVRSALRALEDAGLLDTTESVWVQTKKKLRIDNQLSTAITRKFQRQLIERALGSLDNDPIEVRDHTSITFAVTPKQIPKLKKHIREFRLRTSEIFESPGNSTDVYNLTVQLVPVTKHTKGNS